MASSNPFRNVGITSTDDSSVVERIRSAWEAREKPGIRGVLGTVDHKKIGKRYLITAFIFLLVGGLEALAMRLQLAQPNETLLSPEEYDQFFTLHGSTMIFLYALPILSGFSNYLWPLILGARDMALPRVNALSYWLFLFSGLFLYIGFPTGQGADAGWFNYVPYASAEYSPGPGIDIFALGMIFLGLSTTAGAVNFIVTMFRARAPGMSISRIPIMIWGTLVANVGIIFAVPAVSLAFFLLWLQRRFGAHFFDVAGGGHPLLWQHLFWLFGHPWVYIVVLPAMSIVSQGLPVFCRRPLVGYPFVVLATILTMVLGFGVWVHHMFATGLPAISLGFFGAASMVITIPSAVSVFAWVATIWTGRPQFTTAFKFFAGFVVLFVMGGVTGFMTAAIPLDWQLTDTYFVVGHLHYVLIGINVFAVIGGIYYWFPKMTGRMMSERLGWWNFWTMFVGLNVGFFPMHISGLLGMPRRIYTYPSGMGWTDLNLVTTIGSFIFAIGILLFLINVVVSRVRGKLAGPNPWDADTLEWSTPSPPPAYNFAVIPSVSSRHPLWEGRVDDGDGASSVTEGPLLDEGHETMGTTGLDAEPDVIFKMSGDSYAPLITALMAGAIFVGMLLQIWWLSGGAVIVMAATLIWWLWPTQSLGRTSKPSAKQGSA